MKIMYKATADNRLFSIVNALQMSSDLMHSTFT